MNAMNVRVAKTAAVAAFVTILAGCGGGGGGGLPSQPGGSSNGPDYYVDFSQFEVDSTSWVVAATGQPDTTVAFTWRVKLGKAVNSATTVHLVPAAAPSTERTDSNRLFGASCGLGYYDCSGESHVSTCAYASYSGSSNDPKTRQTSCTPPDLSPYKSRFAPGQYVAVARTCYLTSVYPLTDECVERSVNVTLI